MSPQILMLIALWCGNPTRETAPGVWSARSTHDVDRCRKDFMFCLKGKTLKVDECAQVIKLDDN